MGQVGYLFNDYYKDITATDIAVVNDVGADKEDANYPIENSQNEQVALRTWSDDKTNIKVRFDINSASSGTKELKAFGIFNHNFSGGSVKIYSYTANDYATGQTLEATVTVRAKDMFTRIASPSDRRYWEIDISHNGSATSDDSAYKWGRIMCYTDIVVITDVEDYIKQRGYGYKNIINVTKHGIRAGIHKLMEDRERFELGWNQRTAANAIHTEMRTLYDSVYGDAHPFMFIPDITSTGCYYVYIQDPELLYQEIFGTGSTAHAGGVHLRLTEAVRNKA